MSDKNYSEEEKLAAWNSWKQVCWVHGVGKSLSAGKPAIGTENDAEILRVMIRRAFLRKLDSFGACFADKDDGFTVKMEGLDCALEFDNALLEYERRDQPGFRVLDKRYKDGAHFRKAKAWKDCVWKAVEEGDDKPLAIIEGKLLGSQGVINQVVEDWIEREYSAKIKKNPKTGRDVLVFDVSKDAPSNGGCSAGEKELTNDDVLINAATGGDSRLQGFDIPARAVEKRMSHGLMDAWRKEMENVFSPIWCCAALAKIKGLSIYKDEEILSLMGMRHAKAHALVAEKSIELMRRLPDDLRTWLLSDQEGRVFFLDWIKDRAVMEKAGRLILLRVAAQNKDTPMEEMK